MTLMRRILAPLVSAFLAACAAETWSPPANYSVEVVSGMPAPQAGPGEQFGAIRIRVRDDQGRIAPDLVVELAVAEGGGTAVASSDRTDPAGELELGWILGQLPGPQRLIITPLGGEGLHLRTEIAVFFASDLAVGHFMSCAVDPEGSAWCWGDGLFDGVARGDSGIDVRPDWLPSRVTGGYQFRSISAGGDIACGLDLAGAAWCWGADDQGQLGDGGANPGRCFDVVPCSRFPVPVGGGHQFRDIVAGASTTCAIDLAGGVWCWGRNSSGEGGAGPTAPNALELPTPALISDSAVELHAGYGTFCAKYGTGIVECWGANQMGEVGDTIGSAVHEPSRPRTAELFARLFAAPTGFCGRRADGATWCWGEAGGHRSLLPVRRPELDRFAVLSGDWLGIGWGLDYAGRLYQLYQGDAWPAYGDARLNSALGGGEAGCGLGAGGQVWCWGSNSAGELGNPDHFNWNDHYTYPPVPVSGWYPLP